MSKRTDGIRVWLGSSPPIKDEKSLQPEYQNFIFELFGYLTSIGATILHGGQPEVTRILLKAAKEYQTAKNQLVLAISDYWFDSYTISEISSMRESAVVHNVPHTSGRSQDAALSQLRHWLADRSDCFVGVGGRLDRALHGVRTELEIANSYKLATIALSAFGGQMGQVSTSDEQLIDQSAIGLSLDQKLKLLRATPREAFQELHEVFEKSIVSRNRYNSADNFRILALDGGGVKGAYTSSVLKKLEKDIGVDTASHFDLIAGTSAGGLIALGLAAGKSAKECHEFFVNKVCRVFPDDNVMRRLLRSGRGLLTPKYKLAALEEILVEFFQERTIADLNRRVVIPTYHVASGEVNIFRTKHSIHQSDDSDIRLTEVGLATAAAPTYFKAAQVNQANDVSHHIDGGVWANSPVLVGIVEAMCELNVEPNRIDMFSVGTTSTPFSISDFRSSGGLKWAIRKLKLYHLLGNSQQDAALLLATRILGEGRFCRADKKVDFGRFSLDDASKVEDLVDLGIKTANDRALRKSVRSLFFNGIPAKQFRHV